MKVLLGFLPFGLFALVDRFASTPLALCVAALAAAVLTLRQLAVKQRPKWLDLGATVVFCSLALYTLLMHTAWSVVGVRLCTDVGLLGIVLLSLLVRQPFTLQYAREAAPEGVWAHPAFVRANYRLTAIWAAAFAAIVLADFAMLRGFSVTLGVLVTLAAFGCAGFFTAKAKARR